MRVASVGVEPSTEQGHIRANIPLMSVDRFRGLATKIDDGWESNLAHFDFTLARHKWALGTLECWVRHLRLLAGFTL